MEAGLGPIRQSTLSVSPLLGSPGLRRFFVRSIAMDETESCVTSERPSRHGGSARAKKALVTRNQAEPDPSPAPIEVERSGGWMPPEDLRKAALAALAASGDVALNLHGIDHLDASALQILIALDAEQKRRQRNLQLTNASPRLRLWFEFAGVADLFSHNRAEQQ